MILMKMLGLFEISLVIFEGLDLKQDTILLYLTKLSAILGTKVGFRPGYHSLVNDGFFMVYLGWNLSKRI